ncbi:diguanylate cyclase [bacterium]|jgi:diguanylate cyclase (GGDEF)-like protein|nr:diguanylate cyclase [bacterium]
MEMEKILIDNLTGLKTQKQFFVDWDSRLQRHAAGKGELNLALALIDIDFFKSYNDQYGHLTGDEIIKSLADHLALGLTGLAEVYRYGGEEFAILFPDHEREEAFLLMEKTRFSFAIDHKFQCDSKTVTLPVRFSTGISSFGDDGTGVQEILRKADDALYRAKETGRNKICLSKEEKMVPKTVHYTQAQLNRLGKLKEKLGVVEAILLREALDDLLRKYKTT